MLSAIAGVIPPVLRGAEFAITALQPPPAVSSARGAAGIELNPSFLLQRFGNRP